MTKEQIDDLTRIYGEAEIIQVDQTINRAEDILAIDADVYAVVLPIDIIAELKKQTEKDVIRPVSSRVKSDVTKINPANGLMESEYIFRHEGWQRINRIEIDTEIL